MAWIRLDDQFADHPKIADAGPLASWLHVKALVHCGRYLTDGKLSRAVVASLVNWAGVFVDAGGGDLAGSCAMPDNLKLADHLCDCGIWEHAKGGGYEIHDYLEHQPSKAQVLAERERTRNRVFRSRNGGSTPDVTALHGRSNGVGNTTPDPDPDPDPVPLSRSQSQSTVPIPASNDQNDKNTSTPLPPAGGTRAGKAKPKLADFGEYLEPAKAVLAAMNAARLRYDAKAPELVPTVATLRGIVERLGEGNSVEQCLHVVAVCEHEARATADGANWFNPVSAFEGKNFVRKLSRPVGGTQRKFKGYEEVSTGHKTGELSV